MESQEKSIPKEFQKKLSVWYRQFKVWTFLHYFLGMVGVTSAVGAAYIPCVVTERKGAYLAFIAALCIALLTSLMPSRRARAFLSAWRKLERACTLYKYQNSTIDDLQKAIDEGEEIISLTDAS